MWEFVNPQKYSAALYIRLSKEDEREAESQSVKNQKSMLLSFAQNHQLPVYQIYADDGFSGTTFDRPQFQKMISDIEEKHVNMVITKDLSRLGRDYIQTGYYMEKYFPENHVRYLSLLDGIDTGIESAINDITPFKAIMNDMYAKDISQKIKSVKRDKQKKGLFIGGKAPYGYMLSTEQKNRIVIDEKAACIVRRIFSLAFSGNSCRHIAMMLNEEEIPTPASYAHLRIPEKSPYSGKWSAERITFMLKNRVYIGDMVQGRVRKVNYKSKKCENLPVGEWKVVENTHEAIVERAVFEKVQNLLNVRKKTRCRTYDYPLKGLLYCRECGYPLSMIRRTLADGKEVFYYLCRTYQRFPKLRKCESHYIRKDDLEKSVLLKLHEILNPYMQMEVFQKIAFTQLSKEERKTEAHPDISILQQELLKIKDQMDESYQDKLSGLLEESDFIRIYQKLKDRKQNVEKEIQKVKCTESQAPDWKEEMSRELSEKFIRTADQNRQLLVSLIEKIELTQEKQVRLFFQIANPNSC